MADDSYLDDDDGADGALPMAGGDAVGGSGSATGAYDETAVLSGAGSAADEVMGMDRPARRPARAAGTRGTSGRKRAGARKSGTARKPARKSASAGRPAAKRSSSRSSAKRAKATRPSARRSAAKRSSAKRSTKRSSAKRASSARKGGSKAKGGNKKSTRRR